MSTWMIIAKAELLVSTARLRRSRKILSMVIVSVIAVWAFYFAPQLMMFVVTRFAEEFQMLLALLSSPGITRSNIQMSLIIPVNECIRRVQLSPLMMNQSKSFSLSSYWVGVRVETNVYSQENLQHACTEDVL